MDGSDQMVDIALPGPRDKRQPSIVMEITAVQCSCRLIAPHNFTTYYDHPVS